MGAWTEAVEKRLGHLEEGMASMQESVRRLVKDAEDAPERAAAAAVEGMRVELRTIVESSVTLKAAVLEGQLRKAAEAQEAAAARYEREYRALMAEVGGSCSAAAEEATRAAARANESAHRATSAAAPGLDLFKVRERGCRCRYWRGHSRRLRLMLR